MGHGKKSKWNSSVLTPPARCTWDMDAAPSGSTLVNILSASGYKVEREYYFNDAGNQMDIFNAHFMRATCNLWV